MNIRPTLHALRYISYIREALRKKMYILWQTAKGWVGSKLKNMISFLKEIMTGGLVPESLVRKLKPRIIHYLLKNTIPNPQILHLHLYCYTCHRSIIVLCVCFSWIWILLNLKWLFICASIENVEKLFFMFFIITWSWVVAYILTVLS